MKQKNLASDTIIEDRYLRLQNGFIYILIIYTFLYSNVVRSMLTNLVHVNLLYSFLPTLLIIGYYLYFFKKASKFVIYIFSFIFLLNMTSVFYYHIEVSRFYRFLYSILIPLLLVGIHLEKPKYTIKKFLLLYNIVIIINVIYGVMDFISGKKLQMMLANLLYNTNYYTSINWDIQSQVYRLFSILGHPLTNMFLIVIFIGVNLAYNYYYKEKASVPMYIIYGTTILGTLVCNSKFGIIIVCATLLSIIMVGSNKGRNLVLLLITSISILSIGPIKQNVVQRFLMASESGDLSNGRLSALDYLSDSNVPLPHLFTGGGMGASDSLLQSVSDLNNIEMPFVMYMYDYGILVTILIYIIFCLFPIIIFVKNKHFYLCYIYTLIFVFANSYNGMAVSIGITQILTFVAMLLINMSNKLKKQID
ncbi:MULTISPECIES: hypothetical protein [Priestia]|uniref:hypothetical protein n=1 Tax=unclassified Priestia TaxID=2800374 RepID=UPI0037494366